MRLLAYLALLGVFACHATPDTIPDAGFTGWTLPDLADSDGFSFRLPTFDFPANSQSQRCYFVRVPDINSGASVWIDRVQAAMNPGSHHLSIFRVKTIVGLDPAAGTPTMIGSYPATLVDGGDDFETNPCWLSANWADWPLVANDQAAPVDDPYYDWQMPTDVAIQLQPGEMLMVQSHYVNSTDQPTPFGPRVGINFYSHKSATPPIELGTLFATQQHIRICESTPPPTFSGTCKLPPGSTITAANGHFHSRGKEFDMFAWDGSEQTPAASAQFYKSLEWSEPPMATGLDVAVPSGGGVWWNCMYQWYPPQTHTCADVNAKDTEHQNDCCYTFGGDTDIGEHCNAFVYYYPRGDSDVFCN